MEPAGLVDRTGQCPGTRPCKVREYLLILIKRDFTLQNAFESASIGAKLTKMDDHPKSMKIIIDI